MNYIISMTINKNNKYQHKLINKTKTDNLGKIDYLLKQCTKVYANRLKRKGYTPKINIFSDNAIVYVPNQHMLNAQFNIVTTADPVVHYCY